MLYSILGNIHLHSLSDYTVLQWDEVENWFFASGVLLLFAGFPAESAIALPLTLPTVPGCSVMILGDGSVFETENTPSTKLVLDASV